MLLFLIIALSTLVGSGCNLVASPQIRILDVAQKAFESRFYPHRLDYSDSYHQNIKETIQEGKYQRPFKSYVIYDDFPNKIFKEWEGNSPVFTKRMAPFVFNEFNVNNKAGLPEYYSYDRRHNLPIPNPTLAYQSVYSNVIKVFDNSLDNGQRFGFQSDRLTLPAPDDVSPSFRPPFQYETIYPQEFQKKLFDNQRHSENFPKLFVPNQDFHFSFFNKENSKPPNLILPSNNFFDGLAIKDDAEHYRFKNQAKVISQYETNNSKSNGRVLLCSLIRLNQKQFPENGGPCSRSEENPVFFQEYPDFSKLPNDKIPLEHRRQHLYEKRIKRNDPAESPKKTKRSLGFGNGYDNWESPFSYNGKYGNFFSDYYSSQENYDNYGSSNYNSYNNRNNKRRNRNRGEYNEYDDEEYQSGDDSSSQGLSSYLTNGGRRYRNRQNNDEGDEDNDENDSENENSNKDNNGNNGEDSDEEMEGQNSNGRSMNRRRKNNNSRGRRNNYNNNNSDDEDFRDNRRNNYNNRQNNRRYNKKNNDYYNRNRSSYGYNNNNYNSYGGSGGYGRYGNNRGFGNDYGSGYGSSGYGSSSGYGNNGYGSYNSYGSRGLGFGGYNGYGNYGGYGGYGGYGSYGSGNGYSSFDHDDF